MAAVIPLLLHPLAPPHPQHHTFNTSIIRTLLVHILNAWCPPDLSLASLTPAPSVYPPCRRFYRSLQSVPAGPSARGVFLPSRHPLFKMLTFLFAGIRREARRAVAERLLLADVLRAGEHPRLLRGLLKRNHQDAHPHQDG